MAVNHGEGLVGAVVFLLEIGGAGLALAYPQFRPLGFILMGIGVLPLAYWIFAAIWHLSVVPRQRAGARALPVTGVVADEASRIWVGLSDAVNAFCDHDLILRRDKYNEYAEKGILRTVELQDDMQKLNDAVPGGGFTNRPDDLKEYNRIQANLERLTRLSGITHQQLREAWSELRDDLDRQLASGKLCARGFPEPYVAGSGQITIEQAEWQILVTNLGHSSAVTRIGSDRVYTGVQVARTIPPQLEIVFDPENPGRKFWSLEPAVDDIGNKLPGQFWEYRVAIKNRSPKTLRGVKVIVEAIGPLPSRPQPTMFDINKKPLMDINPGEAPLVPVRRWYYPAKQAGMVVGDAYGPIKVTVSADDVSEIVKVFRFNYEETPMLSVIAG
ncbi:MAG TPA: hypothetical protein VGG10_16840 [Rhizomicrobium sp.]|jgi:hypothetical protein